MNSSRIERPADPDAEKPWLEYYPEWTAHSLEYGGQTLPQLYDANLVKNADKPATRFFGRTQTFGELDREVRRAAAGLKAFGVRPGDRVAIMLPNCPQHVAAFFAVQMIGGVVVEHNPLYTAAELRHQFEDHGARVVIAWDKVAARITGMPKDLAVEHVVAVDITASMPRLYMSEPRMISASRPLRPTAPAAIAMDCGEITLAVVPPAVLVPTSRAAVPAEIPASR